MPHQHLKILTGIGEKCYAYGDTHLMTVTFHNNRLLNRLEETLYKSFHRMKRFNFLKDDCKLVPTETRGDIGFLYALLQPFPDLS